MWLSSSKGLLATTVRASRSFVLAGARFLLPPRVEVTAREPAPARAWLGSSLRFLVYCLGMLLLCYCVIMYWGFVFLCIIFMYYGCYYCYYFDARRWPSLSASLFSPAGSAFEESPCHRRRRRRRRIEGRHCRCCCCCSCCCFCFCCASNWPLLLPPPLAAQPFSAPYEFDFFPSKQLTRTCCDPQR